MGWCQTGHARSVVSSLSLSVFSAYLCVRLPPPGGGGGGGCGNDERVLNRERESGLHVKSDASESTKQHHQ